MGLFSFFASLTPKHAADRIIAFATAINVSNDELNVAMAIGAETHLLVKERVLFRLAFALSSVSYFHGKGPHPKIRELYEILDSQAFHYLFTIPGVSGDEAGQLWARARSDYMVKLPNELASLMITNIHANEFKPVSPQAMAAFLTLVHGYARESMTQAGELAKKLRSM